MKLSIGQWNTIICALRVAAETYAKDARIADTAYETWLRDQFYKQAQDARELAAWIEINQDV